MTILAKGEVIGESVVGGRWTGRRPQSVREEKSWLVNKREKSCALMSNYTQLDDKRVLSIEENERTSC